MYYTELCIHKIEKSIRNMWKGEFKIDADIHWARYYIINLKAVAKYISIFV